MKKLFQGAITTGAGTLCYTVPSSAQTDIQDIEICNTANGAIQFTCCLVPSGGSATANNALFWNANISGYSIVQWTGDTMLSAGDFIQCIGGFTGITVTINGAELVKT